MRGSLNKPPCMVCKNKDYALSIANICSKGYFFNIFQILLFQLKSDSEMFEYRNIQGIKMSKKTRLTFTPERKANIVRRHLEDNVPFSDLFDEYRIQPSLFYQWQRLVMGKQETVFGPSKRRCQHEGQKLGN